MKKQFILFCVTLIAAAPVCFAQASPAKPSKAASNQTAITDLEKSAWESYKNKQADAFKKLMSKDYYGTYAEDIKNLDREVADMAKTDLRDYSLADMKVVFPSAEVAVITYKSTVQQTSEGKDMSGTYNSGSIWVKIGGKWLEVSTLRPRLNKPERFGQLDCGGIWLRKAVDRAGRGKSNCVRGTATGDTRVRSEFDLEKLTAFLELEAAIRDCAELC